MNDTMTAAKERKLWVDGLRAIAMVLVIIGHQLPDRVTFAALTNPIKIPLFFAISGYVFTGGRKTAPEFLKSTFFHIAVPWLIMVLAEALVMTPVRGLRYIPAALADAYNGKSLWYLPCCFFAGILWYAVVRFARTPTKIALTAALCCAAGFVMARFRILNALMINLAFIAQAFMLIGFLFRTHESQLARLGWPVIAALGLLYALLGFISPVLWPQGIMDIHLNRYYNLPYCFLLIWTGCTSLLLAGRKLGTAPRALQFIGQNTLPYYITHGAVVRTVEFALEKLGFQSGTILSAVVYTLLGCVGCAVAAVLINRFLPVLAGRYRPRRRENPA